MLSNLWLFGPLVTRALERTPVTNAWVRTTTAPTMFQSGVKENVLPSRARAVVNFRILQGDSVAAVLAHVRRVVADERVTVTRLEGTVSEPSPESSTTSAGYRLIERTARDLFPDAVPVCTARRDLHDHHLVFRSRGGGNGRENRITLCVWHHLRGVHAGRVRAKGDAPVAITWEIGLRTGRRPLLRLVGERYATG